MSDWERSAVGRAYQQEAARIDAITDPQEAFEQATALANELRNLYQRDVSMLRARQAARIRAAEDLSLAGLAERIDLSRQRAHQLMQLAEGKEPQ